jgi:ABC-type transport system involved in multi-copper enzyme maturation permease subunit
MQRIWTICINTFHEAIRRRILNVMLIFGILLICSSSFFVFLSPGEETKIIKDAGLGSIAFFGMLIAVFGSSGLIPQEVEKRTIYTVLSKPVRRVEFVFGKYLGAVLTVFANLAVMSVVFCGLVFFKEKKFSIDLLKAIVLIFFEMGLLTAIAVCLSTVSSSIFNAIFSMVIYFAGNFSETLEFIGEHSDSRLLKFTGNFLYNIIPNFKNFNDVWNNAVVGVPISDVYVIKTVIYGLSYTAIVLAVSFLLFNQKEV